MKLPHPGEIILEECIKPLGLTVEGADDALGVSCASLNEVIQHRCGISVELAVRLEKVGLGDAESWLLQQLQFDLAQFNRDDIHVRRLHAA